MDVDEPEDAAVVRQARPEFIASFVSGDTSNRYAGLAIASSENVRVKGGRYESNGNSVEGYGITTTFDAYDYPICRNVLIESTTCVNNVGKGIDCHCCDGWTALDNVVSGYGLNGIYAVGEADPKRVANVTIKNNSISIKRRSDSRYDAAIQVGAFGVDARLAPGAVMVQGNKINGMSGNGHGILCSVPWNYNPPQNNLSFVVQDNIIDDSMLGHREGRGIYVADTTTPNPQPPTANSSSLGDPTTPPTVDPIGGGVTGGNIATGSYYMTYTFVGEEGETTSGSSESGQFSVSYGNVPRVTLPALPTGATSINIYLTLPGGGPGTEILYRRRVTTTTYDLTVPWPPPAQTAPPESIVIHGNKIIADVVTGIEIERGAYVSIYFNDLTLLVTVHESKVTVVQRRTGCGGMRADSADIGPEATPVGASVSSDRRAQDRPSQSAVTAG
jgi:hypothetical protein